MNRDQNSVLTEAWIMPHLTQRRRKMKIYQIVTFVFSAINIIFTGIT